MASHGRRYASNYTKLRKQVKKQQRLANTRARKLSKSVYRHGNHSLERDYPKGGFNLKGVKTVNGLRHQQAKTQKFLRAKTSTVGGSKKVIKQTIANIMSGHGGASLQEITQYNNFTVNITSDELGVNLIKNYFDVYYKVKDLMDSARLGSAFSSNDIMQSITSAIEDNTIIKDVDVKGSVNVEDATLTFNTYLSLMNSAELARAVLDKLKEEY